MEKREKSTREEFSQLTDTSGIEQELNGLEETVDTIVEAFAEKSEQLRSSLKGEQLVFSKVADPLSSAAESASATVASMFGSTDESTPASLAESADSLISTAEDALVSVADEMQLTAAAEAVGEQVETASETLDSLLTEAATTASTASYHVVPEEDEPSTGSPPEAPSPSPEEDAEDIEDGFETSASAAFEAPSASEGEPTQAVEDSPSHDAGDFIFAAQTPGSRDATDDATSPQEAVVEDIPTSSQTQIPEHQEL